MASRVRWSKSPPLGRLSRSPPLAAVGHSHHPHARDRVVGINLTGVFLALHYELELMLAQGKGAIVNTTSLAGLTGPARAGAYSAPKWGVIGLTRVAANEHARFGIRVNAVAPGFTLTAMVDRDEAMMPGWKQSQIEETPMHRGAHPAEIARAVVWLASDDASFVIDRRWPSTVK